MTSHQRMNFFSSDDFLVSAQHAFLADEKMRIETVRIDGHGYRVLVDTRGRPRSDIPFLDVLEPLQSVSPDARAVRWLDRVETDRASLDEFESRDDDPTPARGRQPRRGGAVHRLDGGRRFRLLRRCAPSSFITRVSPNHQVTHRPREASRRRGRVHAPQPRPEASRAVHRVEERSVPCLGLHRHHESRCWHAVSRALRTRRRRWCQRSRQETVCWRPTWEPSQTERSSTGFRRMTASCTSSPPAPYCSRR